jgi:hypothetical protein
MGADGETLAAQPSRRIVVTKVDINTTRCLTDHSQVSMQSAGVAVTIEQLDGSEFRIAGSLLAAPRIAQSTRCLTT